MTEAVAKTPGGLVRLMPLPWMLVPVAEDRRGRALYWKQFERTRAAWYRKVERLVAARFASEALTLSVRMGMSSSPGQGLALVEMAIRTEVRPQWESLLTDLYTAVGGDFAKRVDRGLKHAFGPSEVKLTIDVWKDTVLEWLATNAGLKITLITETTRRLLMTALMDGVAKGDGIPKLVARLRNTYADMSRNRATMIARTETIAASNLGGRAGALNAGLKLNHFWIATADDRTREHHRVADGQVQPIIEPYTVLGERLLFPGDTSYGASGKNTIMCRCTEGYRKA